LNADRDTIIKPEATLEDVINSLNPIQKIAFLRVLLYFQPNSVIEKQLENIEITTEEDINDLTIEDIFKTLDPLQSIIVADAIEKFKENIDKKKEIKHYGILGMKWGVRKEYKYDSELRAKGTSSLGSWNRTKEEQDLVRKTSGVKFKSMNDDITISRNIQNILYGKADQIDLKSGKLSTTNPMKLDLNKPVFFSVTDSDKQFWKYLYGTTSDYLKENDIKLKKPIKIAGIDTMVKTWMEANKDHKFTKDDLKDNTMYDIFAKKKLKSGREMNKEMKFYKKTGMVPAKTKEFIQTQTTSLAVRNIRDNKSSKTFDNFKKKLLADKYDGYLDLNAGYGQVSYAGIMPSVLLNSKAVKNIRQKNIPINERLRYKQLVAKSKEYQEYFKQAQKFYPSAFGDQTYSDFVESHVNEYGYDRKKFKNPYANARER